MGDGMFMYDELLSIEAKFDLFNETIKRVKEYFLSWKEELPNDFYTFISENNIQMDTDSNLKNVVFRPFKIGYEIRVAQENIIAISVVLDIFVENNDSPICSYYCYYDKEGTMIDNFIDC